jgi:N-acetylneuraminate synthase
MRTRFVAEVSSNHACAGIERGSREHLERALAFVDRAAELGCAAVKFQQFRVRELFAREALEAHPHLLQRQAWELPEEFNAVLARRAHERGIAFASTPFHRAAVDLLAPLVDFFKLASYQLLWHEQLAAVARTGKPVVLATGMASLAEVGAAVRCLRESGCRELELLHCVSVYPAAEEEANLAALQTLRREFGLDVGWSDHTRSPAVIERAVRRWGASMVEFHLDLDGRGAEYVGDARQSGHCWLPGEIAWVLAQIERPAPGELPRSQPCDGDGHKEPGAGEAHEARWRTDPSDGLRPLLATRAQLVHRAVRDVA